MTSIRPLPVPLLTALLLAACVRTLPDEASAPIETAIAFTPAPATFTPLPPSPTTEPPTATATTEPIYIAGLLAVKAMDQEQTPFVFLLDPYAWQTQESAECQGCALQLEFIHWDLAGCSLLVDTGVEFPVEQTASALFGARAWQVESNDLGSQIRYSSLWGGPYQLRLLARGTGDPECRSAVEAVLAETYLTWEVLAVRLPSGLPTPAPLPLPEDYGCESLPPRLRVGDSAQVIADSIWVRSEPRRAGDTRILLLYKDLPLALIIHAGPVCAEGFTFWNVRYYAGSEYSGWIAESDSLEYFLEPISP